MRKAKPKGSAVAKIQSGMVPKGSNPYAALQSGMMPRPAPPAAPKAKPKQKRKM